MPDVEQLQVHRIGSHSLTWLDDLAAAFPNHRPHTAMAKAIARNPDFERHFPNKKGRTGATVRGFRLISLEWPEEEREPVLGLYSRARSGTWCATHRSKPKVAKPKPETKQAPPLSDDPPEEIGKGEAIPPETDEQPESGNVPVTRDFFFKGSKIRVVFVNDEPYWVAPDVCDRLGYADGAGAVAKHCRGSPIRRPIPDALGRNQPTRILPEGDVFRLIMGSEKPEAEEFRTWVCDEVLPSIRKTGAYQAQGQQRTYERIEDPRIDKLFDAVASLAASVAEIMKNQASSPDRQSRASKTRDRYDRSGRLTIDLFCQENDVDFEWFCQFAGPGAFDDDGIKQFGFGLLYQADNGRWRVTGPGLQSRMFVDAEFFTEADGRRVDRSYAKLTKQGESFFKGQLTRMTTSKGPDLFGNVIRPRRWNR